MEIVGPELTPFVNPIDTDAAYPARIGEPSVDGPIIYPEQQPDEPQNILPFQRETGIDPTKIPSLKDIAPKLKLLEGGKKSNSNVPVPQGRIANITDPTTMVRFGAAPDAEGGFPWKLLLVAAGAAAVGYFVGRSNGDSGPLIADMSDEE